MRSGRWYLVTLLCGLFAIVLLVLGMRGLVLAKRVPLPSTEASLSRLEQGVTAAARRLERHDSRQHEAGSSSSPAEQQEPAALDRRAMPSPPPQDGKGAAMPGKSKPAAAKRQPLNINTATAAELDTLPGVGPVLALRILEYRRAHGPFKRVEGLDMVKGIGPAKLAEIKEYCYAGPAK